ncbi:hypothetical protein SP15_257 [Bacillus phage SP-15]|uniref:Uncharacterized protein n=1 Tax=Bacillus phage SP-15 TaxID=1792032 RepID=A0A127AXW2_9CAUD|nr:hypothetical protein SP15_257 [Bacillus phage SP-15]AMM45064.1 hypothetical protein SP15_257 [Bacillus phage SP-15]
MIRKQIPNMDSDLRNADWSKVTWDLPPYKSKEFMDQLKATKTSLDSFRKLPKYKHAVRKGLIVNDEWEG